MSRNRMPGEGKSGMSRTKARKSVMTRLSRYLEGIVAVEVRFFLGERRDAAPSAKNRNPTPWTRPERMARRAITARLRRGRSDPEEARRRLLLRPPGRSGPCAAGSHADAAGAEDRWGRRAFRRSPAGPGAAPGLRRFPRSRGSCRREPRPDTHRFRRRP